MVATPEPDTAAQRSLAETWTEVVADAGGLLRAEAAMARLETGDNLKAFGGGMARIGAGALLLGLSLVFVLVAAVLALALVVGTLWALLLVAIGSGAAGFALLMSARNRMQEQKLLPQRSMKRMAGELERLASKAPPVGPARGGTDEGTV